jgi:hypothetical protein
MAASPKDLTRAKNLAMVTTLTRAAQLSPHVRRVLAGMTAEIAGLNRHVRDLQGHVTTLETAIKAIVAESPKAGKDLEMAAMHMSGTAEVLAKGIVSSKGISGNVTSGASALRAALTGLLIQHVAATGFVV